MKDEETDYGFIDKDKFEIVVGFKQCKKNGVGDCEKHKSCGSSSMTYAMFEMDVDEAVEILSNHISQKLLKEMNQDATKN